MSRLLFAAFLALACGCAAAPDDADEPEGHSAQFAKVTLSKKYWNGTKPALKALWDAHPSDMSPEEVKAAVGGEVAKMGAEPGYSDTCALRMSVALTATGFPIPDALHSSVGADGNVYAWRADELSQLLTSELGTPTVQWTPKDGDLQGALGGKKGIIVFKGPAHIDLWDGTEIRWNDVSDRAKSAVLYELD